MLPLDTFAKLVGIHPLHFNQVEVQDLANASDATSPLLQYNWQEVDRVSRDDLAKEIRSVEDQLEPWLGFSPLAKWYEENIATTHPEGSLFNVQDQWWNEQLQVGYIRTGGVEAWLLISPGETVTYTDGDGDGYTETATITVTTTVTDPSEIALCYPGSDDPNLWEVRPRKITIAGGVATIVCRREQLVVAALMESLKPSGVDGLDDANFLATVDIYRHWNDPSDQGMMIWTPFVTPGVVQTQTHCLTVRDPRLGIVHIQPATWTGTAFTAACSAFPVRPNRLQLKYYAGQHAAKMDPQWEYVITALTCAQIDRPLCGGDTTQALIKYWKEDKSLRYSNGVEATSWSTSKRILENPLGSTRAADYAWRAIQQSSLRR